MKTRRILRTSTSVANHLGTFTLAADWQDEPVEDLKRALAGLGDTGTRFWIRDFGEAGDVPPIDGQAGPVTIRAE